MKEVREKGDTYTIYEDYSVDVTCRGCGKSDHLEAGTKAASVFAQIPGSASGYDCSSCYRKKKEDKDSEREDKIRWAQALNLAVAMIPESLKSETKWISDESVKEKIVENQRWFYELLKNRK